jgi:hypothetical protein
MKKKDSETAQPGRWVVIFLEIRIDKVFSFFFGLWL